MFIIWVSDPISKWNCKMSIKGLKIEKQKGFALVIVEQFSKELQELIRSQLAGIFHGFAEVQEIPNFYSYPKTLQGFLDRYNSKSEETKKGMIGELLAHVLIAALFEKLVCLSILKNKEERSIKKGFDIIYYHTDTKNLWYTEVKSGRSEDGSASSDSYNTELLKRSRDSILEMFESKRNSLWESAIIDVKLAVEEGTPRTKMRELLSKDAPNTAKKEAKKSVILVSVLYHELHDKMSLAEIEKFHKRTTSEKVFKSAVIFSIQKKTFDKVATFLTAEAKKAS